MSSVASSVKIAATSGSKSDTSSATSAGTTALAAGATDGKEAGGAATAGATLAGEAAGAGSGAAACSAARAAAAMRCSSCSVRARCARAAASGLRSSRSTRPGARPRTPWPHAVGQQLEVLASQPEAAVEGLAQPVIERLGQADAVARLGHPRTARQRVAGAIDLLGDACGALRMRSASTKRARWAMWTCGLAAVDVAQLQIAAGFLLRRRQHDFFPGLIGLVFECPRRSRGCRRRIHRGRARRRSMGRRLQRRHATGGLQVVAARVERALQQFHGGGLRAHGLVGGQRMRAIDDVLRARRRRLAVLERVDQLPAHGDGVAQRREDRRRALQRVVDAPGSAGSRSTRRIRRCRRRRPCGRSP